MKYRLTSVLLVLALASPTGMATTLSAKEILAASDTARGGGLPGIVWDVEVMTKDEESGQVRSLVVKASGEDSLVEFRAPPKVRGQRLLMAGRNMWFSRPGLQKPVPISPRQRLLGEAATGDIASTNYAADYSGTIVGSERVGQEDCYVLDLRATNKWVTYDRIVYWVSKTRLVGIKADFYTVSGKLFKSAVFEYGNQVVHDGNKQPFVSKMIITDALVSTSTTTLEYSNIRATQIPRAQFSIDFLTK